MTEFDAVVKALKKLGGEAHYTDIAKIAKTYLPSSKSKSFENNIRRAIYQHSSDSVHFLGKKDAFYAVKGIKSRSGIWGLRNYQPTIKTMDITQDDISFPEGKAVFKKHIVYERNKGLIKKAKELFKKAHGGKLFCEVCGCDFSYHYPTIGDDFIEVHHIKPVSKRNQEKKQR